MMSLLLVFYIFIVLFAIVGAMRGWAKEVLVIFSVILALAFITILENLVPVVRDFLTGGSIIQFWVRTAILILMVFFGYQSPRIQRLAAATARREQIQDVLLGVILGAVNGFLIVGTLWAFLEDAGYPFAPLITRPTAADPMGPTALQFIDNLPLYWLGRSPNIFIAVVLAFIFVIVVFI